MPCHSLPDENEAKYHGERDRMKYSRPFSVRAYAKRQTKTKGRRPLSSVALLVEKVPKVNNLHRGRAARASLVEAIALIAKAVFA